MSDRKIKAKVLSWEEIRQTAEIFRKQYVTPVDTIPVPIETIVEFDLKLEILPIHGMREKTDIDGFLTSDMKTIYVDAKILMEDRYQNRLRFTYAHEIGHLVLHEEEIRKFKFRNYDEWMHFRKEIGENDLIWFEQQAYEFAGRLLVPRQKLSDALEGQMENIELYLKSFPNSDNDKLIDSVANAICQNFEVSSSVIYRRIRREKLWEELGL